MDLKTCKICEVAKPASDFSKNRSRRDGLHYNCKPCDTKKARDWELKNPERKTANSIAYRKKNRERLLEADRHRYYANRDAALNQRRDYYVKNKKTIIQRVGEWGYENRDKTRSYMRAHYQRNKTEYMEKTAKRRAAKLSATLPWLTSIHQAQIKEMYDVALACAVQTGVKHHVDHIHPLQGDGFTGLHVPWNLQVIPVMENLSKGCRLPPKDAHLGWGYR